MRGLVLTSLVATGCGTQAVLPRPRPIIVHSGVRVTAQSEEMQAVREWLQPQVDNIREDPSFLISTEPRDEAPLPWEALVIHGDTARIPVPGNHPGARIPFMVYAHLRLMERRDELQEWLPGSYPGAYEVERAMADRVADAWLFQRSIGDIPPYEPLDELLYAREYGYLDAYLLTARPAEFPERRETWLEENPGVQEEYREWFRTTFSREPPGLRNGGTGGGGGA